MGRKMQMIPIPRIKLKNVLKRVSFKISGRPIILFY